MSPHDPEHDASSGAVAFFEMSLDHLCVAGFDGYFKRLNPSWTRTLGWTHEELMSRPTIELVHPDDHDALHEARGHLRSGLPLHGLVNRYRCKDGKYRTLAWAVLANVERELVYGVARDVTAEQEAREAHERLQRQLILADRMASVGTLAAGVGHEINNPLAYVTANLEMLIEELGAVDARPSAAQVSDWVEMAIQARQGAERIRKIVHGLKTFSRSGAETRAVLDVHPVLERSISMALGEIRHRARLVTDYGDTPLVEADDASLGQVFVNLLVNAAQALPEGATDANEVRIVTSTDAEGRAVIEVRDTGSGMPPGVLGRVFDPFFTTKPIGVGTGLGLSICHNIIASVGGVVSATSEEGRGSVFRVVLPAAVVPPRAPAPGSSAAPAANARRARVLVVDDEPAIGTVLGRVLREHDVTIVGSAKEALDVVVAGEPFDVILSDLMMPGMSGMDLHDELSRLHPQSTPRMVFMTGGAFTPAATAFLARVPNDRIQKPFEATTVRELVGKLVRTGPRAGTDPAEPRGGRSGGA